MTPTPAEFESRGGWRETHIGVGVDVGGGDVGGNGGGGVGIGVGVGGGRNGGRVVVLEAGPHVAG